jgi:hypothetical protein
MLFEVTAGFCQRYLEKENYQSGLLFFGGSLQLFKTNRYCGNGYDEIIVFFVMFTQAVNSFSI